MIESHKVYKNEPLEALPGSISPAVSSKMPGQHLPLLLPVGQHMIPQEPQDQLLNNKPEVALSMTRYDPKTGRQTKSAFYFMNHFIETHVL